MINLISYFNIQSITMAQPIRQQPWHPTTTTHGTTHSNQPLNHHHNPTTQYIIQAKKPQQLPPKTQQSQSTTHHNRATPFLAAQSKINPTTNLHIHRDLCTSSAVGSLGHHNHCPPQAALRESFESVKIEESARDKESVREII